MALFKIFKGKPENLGKLGNTTENTNEGYAYFTPEDGKFYIDVDSGNKAIVGNYFGEQIQQKDGTIATANRICINQKIFTYNDYDILDCGGAIPVSTENLIIFDCGDSTL